MTRKSRNWGVNASLFLLAGGQLYEWEVLVQKDFPPLHLPLQNVCLFQFWQKCQEAFKERGMIVLVGATGLLSTQPVLSLDLWPVLLLGFLFGESRQLGELQGGWWTAGTILKRGREKRSESMRGEGRERGKMKSLLWTNRKARWGDGGPRSSFTSLSSLLLWVSIGTGVTHSYTGRHSACEKVAADLAGALSLCCFAFCCNKSGRRGAGNVNYPRVQIHGYGNNPSKLTLGTRLQNTEADDVMGWVLEESIMVKQDNFGRFMVYVWICF